MARREWLAHPMFQVSVLHAFAGRALKTSALILPRFPSWETLEIKGLETSERNRILC